MPQENDNQEPHWAQDQPIHEEEDRMVHKPVLTGILLAAILAFPGCSGNAPDASEKITSQGLLQDTQALASDEMEGRGTGTAGEEKAVRYIESRFREIGLAPINGSYLQPVRMVGMKKNAEASSLRIRNSKGALAYQSDETLTYYSTAQKDVVDLNNAPLLFVGYGVEAPEYQWDDFKGADLKGKVLLFLNNDPPVTENGVDLFGGEARTYYGRWTYKFEQAMKHGAAGAFMIHTTPSASYPFSVVQRSGSEEAFALDLPGSGYQVDILGWIDEFASNKIAEDMGSSLEELFTKAARRDFRPIDTGFRVTAHIETAIRHMETRNVYGMLEGSDPARKDEIVVFSAHYDHLGMDPNLPGDDKIFNGAWDNAAGTACIIEQAAAFTALQPRPKRSLVFLACAAEEKGSLGSEWFVKQPPVELSRIVADFNIDMPQIFGVTTDFSVIGADLSTLGEDLRQTAAAFMVKTNDGGSRPVEVAGDPNPNAGSFYRSDHVNFAKAGIPALYYKPGSSYVNPPAVDPKEYEEENYHQVSDQVNELWDLSGLERDMRLFFKTALRVADSGDMPRWRAGSEFEAAWKILHPDQQ
jgi:Zn-dependent M28 family amino/carboxypeptidase